MKKRLIYLMTSIVLAIVIMPFFSMPVHADEFTGSLTSETFADGIIVRQRGSSISYLIADHKKWKILDRYTFSQVSVPGVRPVISSKDVLDNVPNGPDLKISRPKIKGIIDMHEHFRTGGNMEAFLDAARKLGIVKTVFLPTGAAPDNRGYKLHTKELLKKQQKYPDEIMPFCTIDEADPSAPEVFSDCLDHGGKGLKILGGHPALYDAPLDNEAMQRVFAIVNEKDLPVIVHVSITTLPSAKKEFIHLMDLYPNTRVQFAHMCTAWVHVDQCAWFLDRYPNMIIDLSMGSGFESFYSLLMQTYSGDFFGKPGEKLSGRDIVKDFLIKYQDRVVFGSDVIVLGTGPTSDSLQLKKRMMCDISMLQEEWFRCPIVNTKYALVPGLNFSDEVLKKIFVDNPKKFLKIDE